jgi:hypothetical protein
MAKTTELATTRFTSAMVEIQARRRFLEAIEEHAPHLLDELRQMAGLPDSGLRKSVEKWAVSHHLEMDGGPARWMIQTATSFCLEPGLRGFPGVVGSEWSGLTDDDTRILIQTSWDPLTERRASVKKRILDSVTERMNAIQAKLPKARTEKRVSEHFVWLVRYQIAEISAKDIAAGPPIIELAAVQKALRETASILGLTLRVRPGRPKILLGGTVK